MRRIAPVAFLFLGGVAALVLAEATLASAVRPETYHSYVREDRWGQKLFQSGRQAWLLSDQAFLRLRPLTGKSVALTLMDPGRSGTRWIDGISSATVVHVPLEITLEPRFDVHHQLAHETLLVTVTIRNFGVAPLDVHGKKLRLVLMRRSEIGLLYPEEEVLGHPAEASTFREEPEDVSFGDQAGPWIMVREIPCTWRNASPVGRLEGGVSLQQTFAFGEDLPTGEFEIFAVWGEADDPKVQRPMSDVRSFEIYAP